MPLIYADVEVICPKTNEKVTVRNNCANIDGKGNPCEFFNGLSYRGWKMYVVCNYGEKNQKEQNHE